MASEVSIREQFKPTETDNILTERNQYYYIPEQQRGLFIPLGWTRRDRGREMNTYLTLNALKSLGNPRLSSYKTCRTKADKVPRVIYPPGMKLPWQCHLCTFSVPRSLARSWPQAQAWPWHQRDAALLKNILLFWPQAFPFPAILKDEYQQMSENSNSRAQKQRVKLTLIYWQGTAIILTWQFLILKWQNKTNSRGNDWSLIDHGR